MFRRHWKADRVDTLWRITCVDHILTSAMVEAQFSATESSGGPRPKVRGRARHDAPNNLSGASPCPWAMRKLIAGTLGR